jgi:hypothetical protein
VAALTLVSLQLAWRIPGMASMGVVWAVLAGVVYLGVVFRLTDVPVTSRVMVLIVLVGVAMRLPWMVSPTIDNADYWRYFWDGAVTASGVNPYRYSPQRAIDGENVPAELDRLAGQGSDVLKRVTYPHLRTIYPPLAQGAFAAAHVLTPFRVIGWRIVLLLFDIICVTILWRALLHAGLPFSHLIIYLWNPVLVVEVYHGGHVDMLAAACVVLFVALLADRRIVAASAALAAGVGAKLWPALLVGFLIFAPGVTRTKRLFAMAVFGVLAAIVGALFAESVRGHDSGTLAYSATWQANAGAYYLFGRYGVAAILFGASLVVAWQVRRGRVTIPEGVGWVVLLMLLLSPTLYPWYYVPLIALATLARRVEFLIWTALLPLVYLSPGVVPTWVTSCAVHLPVWTILLVRCVQRRERTVACTTV